MINLESFLFVLSLLSALGCGLMAGAFFIFSVAVMRALGKIPPAEGIRAMQSINIVIINPWFLCVFIGTAVGCLLMAGAALWSWYSPGTSFILIGSLLYILGTFAVTIALNVPLNNALAAVVPTNAESEPLWTDYLTNWTFWNHIRTLAALGATAFLIIGIYCRAA